MGSTEIAYSWTNMALRGQHALLCHECARAMLSRSTGYVNKRRKERKDGKEGRRI